MVLATAVPRWKLSPVSTSSRMLSFGGDNSSSRSNSPRQLADEAIEWFAGHSPRNKTSAFNKQGLSLQIIFLAILVVATSWAACAHTSHRTSLLLRQLQDKQARYRLHLDHTYESLDQSRHAYKQETALLKKWRKTEKALEHELRVMQELANANVKMYPMSNRAPTEIVTEWLEHRQVGLERQVDTMSKYLQNYSKDRVLERYVLAMALALVSRAHSCCG